MSRRRLAVRWTKSTKKLFLKPGTQVKFLSHVLVLNSSSNSKGQPYVQGSNRKGVVVYVGAIHGEAIPITDFYSAMGKFLLIDPCARLTASVGWIVTMVDSPPRQTVDYNYVLAAFAKWCYVMKEAVFQRYAYPTMANLITIVLASGEVQLHCTPTGATANFALSSSLPGPLGKFKDQARQIRQAFHQASRCT